VNLTVGGSAPGAGNVISGNVNQGIAVTANSSGVNIEGNYIGTDATGEHAVLTSGYALGIYISDQTGTVVGGTDPGAGNLISGNPGQGIVIDGSGVSVQGNLIGTDATHEAALGNWEGILNDRARLRS
jgi:hypothetical protein